MQNSPRPYPRPFGTSQEGLSSDRSRNPGNQGLSALEILTVEEHAVKLSNIVYRTIFLLSLLIAYQMTVTALKGQSGITLEATEN